MHFAPSNAPMLADSSPLPQSQSCLLSFDRGEFLQQVFACITDAIFVINAYACIVDANQAACQTTGYSHEELAGMELASVLQGASAQGLSGWLLTIETEVALQWKCRTKTGEVRTLDARVTRMLNAAEVLFVASCRAVSAGEQLQLQQIADLRLSNERLVDSEQRLRAMIDNAPSFLWTGQTDGYIDFLSKGWLDYTGLSVDEACGWGWTVVFHPEDVDGLVGYWRSILTAGTPGEIEARIRRHDGEFRWFLMRGFPAYNSDGVLVKWYGTSTEVETRKASENLALCQMKAMEHTLCAVARESDPTRVLAHVLAMISNQVDAHSVSVWERKAGDELQLAATFESAQITVPSPDASEIKRISLMTATHPVWREMYRTGTDCVWGEVENGILQIRLAGREHATWHPWNARLPNNALIEAIYKRLMNSGLMAILTVPMLVAGRVAGVLSIRLTHKQQPPAELLTLIRALAHQAMLAIQLMRLQPPAIEDPVQI